MRRIRSAAEGPGLTSGWNCFARRRWARAASSWLAPAGMPSVVYGSSVVAAISGAPWRPAGRAARIGPDEQVGDHQQDDRDLDSLRHPAEREVGTDHEVGDDRDRGERYETHSRQ